MPSDEFLLTRAAERPGDEDVGNVDEHESGLGLDEPGIRLP